MGLDLALSAIQEMLRKTAADFKKEFANAFGVSV